MAWLDAKRESPNVRWVEPVIDLVFVPQPLASQ